MPQGGRDRWSAGLAARPAPRGEPSETPRSIVTGNSRRRAVTGAPPLPGCHAPRCHPAERERCNHAGAVGLHDGPGGDVAQLTNPDPVAVVPIGLIHPDAIVGIEGIDHTAGGSEQPGVAWLADAHPPAVRATLQIFPERLVVVERPEDVGASGGRRRDRRGRMLAGRSDPPARALGCRAEPGSAGGCRREGRSAHPDRPENARPPRGARPGRPTRRRRRCSGCGRPGSIHRFAGRHRP